MMVVPMPVNLGGRDLGVDTLVLPALLLPIRVLRSLFSAGRSLDSLRAHSTGRGRTHPDKN